MIDAVNDEDFNVHRIFLFFLMLFPFFSNAQCLNNGDKVTLTGVLVIKTYQSPDDEPHPVSRWILQLDKPFECFIDVDTSFNYWNRDVTIMPSHSSEHVDLNVILNKRISASGKIALAATAYNYTAVLLLTDKIAIISEK